MSENTTIFEQRNVQAEALAEIQVSISAGERSGLLNMATGLGKTYVAALAVNGYLEDNPDARVIVTCHNNEILRQDRATFEQVLGPDVGHGNIFEGQNDSSKQIVYASFQSLNGKDELYRAFKPGEFQFAVDDEGHHAMARTHAEVLRYLQPDYLLGLSATPERRDGRDILDIFGRVLYRKRLEEALAEELLTPVRYKTFIDNVGEMSDIVDILNDVGWSGLNEALFIPKRDEDVAELFLSELDQIDNPHGIVYASSIEHAERVAKLLPDAVAIHSKLSFGQQRELTSAFRHNEIPLAITIDKFNEGIDVPDVNFLGFLRSTTSLRVWMQQLGRGLRAVPGKEEVRVADLALSFERIQMVLDLEERIARVREQVEPDRPRFIGTKAKFEFTEQTRDAIRLVREARTNYEQFSASKPKPYDDVGDISLRFRYDGKMPDTADYAPSETLVFRHIWESPTGSVTAKDIQQAHMIQLRKKQLVADIRNEMDANMRSFGSLENVVRHRPMTGSMIPHTWRLSQAAISELLKEEPFAESYRQSQEELLRVIGDFVEQARSKTGRKISFFDLRKTDDHKDQIRVSFDEDDRIRLSRYFGKSGRKGTIDESDLTGTEVLSLPKSHAERQNWASHYRCYNLEGETVIDPELTIANLKIAGPDIPIYNLHYAKRHQIPKYSYDLERIQTPGEIRNITQQLEQYKLGYVSAG